jgi:hypothetical protein
VPAEERGSPLAVALVALAGEHCCWRCCSWMSWLAGWLSVAAAGWLAGWLPFLKCLPACLRICACIPSRPPVAPCPSSGVLDPHESSINAEPLKIALREAGALGAAAQVAAEHSAALADTSPTMHTVRSLWRLQKWVAGMPQWQLATLLQHACLLCLPAGLQLEPIRSVSHALQFQKQPLQGIAAAGKFLLCLP